MPPIEPSDSDRTVRPFELFFDLVFVFAFTQVTLLMATDITWRGLGGGFLLLGTLWLAWQSYAWLGTAIALDEGGRSSGDAGGDGRYADGRPGNPWRSLR